MTDKPIKRKLSLVEIIKSGSIIGLIITLPTLGAFGIVYYISNDVIYGAVAGAIINFIALGFSLKISKRLMSKYKLE